MPYRPENFTDPAIVNADQSLGGFHESLGCASLILLFFSLLFIFSIAGMVLIMPEISGIVVEKDYYYRRGSTSYYVKVEGNDRALNIPYWVFSKIQKGEAINKPAKSIFLKHNGHLYLLISLWHLGLLSLPLSGILAWKFPSSTFCSILANIYNDKPIFFQFAVIGLIIFFVIMGL